MPRARLSATLVDGLRLYAEGARVPVAAGPLALEGGADSRVGVGMALDFGRGGGAVGIYGRFAGTGPDGGTVAGRVHITGERGPELVGPVYVVRVALEGVDDDRAFVALVRQVRSLAADKPGRRRVVQDRERRARHRAHRGAARADGVPARARQARLRLRAVAVDARVLPGRGRRRASCCTRRASCR